MEEWINLLDLDSQPSSQLFSKESLNEIKRGLKDTNCLSRTAFSTITRTFGSRIALSEANNLPNDLTKICELLFEHLMNLQELVPDDIMNFFAEFVKPLLGVSMDFFVFTYGCLLQKIVPVLTNSSINVFLKCAILSLLNEISVLPSATKVKLYTVPEISESYISLAAAIRDVGDYDNQVQLVELLLRVIPAVKRPEFARCYVCPNSEYLAQQFCSLIGQQFEPVARKFLNTFNKECRNSQRVFSVPCMKIHVCDKELLRPTTDGSCFWLDFNLVSERITSYCRPPPIGPLSNDAESPGEQTWETLHLFPAAISEVNLSYPNEAGVADEFYLHIETTTPIKELFDWAPSESGTTIVFTITGEAVLSSLPPAAELANLFADTPTNGQTQLLELLRALMQYAGSKNPSSALDTSGTRHQACCKSPVLLETAQPRPKSFFRDQEVSFEESAEGLGSYLTPGPSSALKHLMPAAIVSTPLPITLATTTPKQGSQPPRSQKASEFALADDEDLAVSADMEGSKDMRLTHSRNNSSAKKEALTKGAQKSSQELAELVQAFSDSLAPVHEAANEALASQLSAVSDCKEESIGSSSTKATRTQKPKATSSSQRNRGRPRTQKKTTADLDKLLEEQPEGTVSSMPQAKEAIPEMDETVSSPKIAKNAAEAVEIGEEGESRKTDPPASPCGQDIFELSLTPPDQPVLEEKNSTVTEAPQPLDLALTGKALEDLSPERMRGAPVDPLICLIPTIPSAYLASPVCEPEIVGVSIKAADDSSKSPQGLLDEPKTALPAAMKVPVDMDISVATPLQRVSQKSPKTERMEEIKEDSQEYAIFGSPPPTAPDSALRGRSTGRPSTSFMTGVEGEDEESISRALVTPNTARVGESDAAMPIPSPLSFSGLRKAEKAICEKKKTVGAVKRLCDTTNTYLEDKSPVCSQSQGSNSRSGAILVPLLGKMVDLKRKAQPSKNKAKIDPLPPTEPLITNLVSPTAVDSKITTTITTTHPVSPTDVNESQPKALPSRKKRQSARGGMGRRFFASSFAERCRRDEIRFLQACKATKPNTTTNESRSAADARKTSRRPGKQVALDEVTLSQLSYLEDKDSPYRPPKSRPQAGGSSGSCTLKSRPAIRKAAAIARSRMAIDSDDDADHSFSIADSEDDQITSRPHPRTCSAAGKSKAASSRNQNANEEADFLIPSSVVEANAPEEACLRSISPMSSLEAPLLFDRSPNSLFELTTSFDDAVEAGGPQKRTKRTRGRPPLHAKGGGKVQNRSPLKKHRSLSLPSANYMRECLSALVRYILTTEDIIMTRFHHIKDQAKAMQKMIELAPQGSQDPV